MKNLSLIKKNVRKKIINFKETKNNFQINGKRANSSETPFTLQPQICEVSFSFSFASKKTLLITKVMYIKTEHISGKINLFLFWLFYVYVFVLFMLNIEHGMEKVFI